MSFASQSDVMSPCQSRLVHRGIWRNWSLRLPLSGRRLSGSAPKTATPRSIARRTIRVQILYKPAEIPANSAVGAIAISVTYRRHEKGGKSGYQSRQRLARSNLGMARSPGGKARPGNEGTLFSVPESAAACEVSATLQAFFNAEKLVEFRHPLAAATRACLDVARPGRHCKVRDEGIFRLARPV